MQEMKIKIITNFVHDGKKKEIAEEVKHFITDPPQRKDTTMLSNLIKKMFEDELNRQVVVKVRVNKESVIAKVQIRPTREEEKAVKK
jgi:hypothetical protein